MRFEEHGEGGIARGDSEEIGSAFALLPERGANLGAAAGKKERAGGGFAEFCSEERGGAELADDQELRVGGVGEKESGIGGRVGVGETQNEAVVGGHGFDVGTSGVGDLRGGGHGPGGMNAVAERSKDADAPVAELVADAFDDDVAIIGNGRWLHLPDR